MLADRNLWAFPTNNIPAPKGATVVFNLVYYFGGPKSTDDNQGNWYVVK
jgi:hypothetical protein